MFWGPDAVARAIAAAAIPKLGVTDGSNAAAGEVGEYVESFVVTPVPLTTATPANVTSKILQPGDWDIYAVILFTTDALTNFTIMHGGLSAVSASINGINFDTLRTPPGVLGAGSTFRGCAPWRKSLNVPTEIFLIASATFSAGTVVASGELSARRVR